MPDVVTLPLAGRAVLVTGASSGIGRAIALAAARALADGPLDAEAIVRRSLDIAADICVYTNRNVTIETLKT